MNLIALRDFRNTHPEKIKINEPIHPDHVHKGATFELDEKAKDNDELILLLNAANAVGDAGDKRVVEAVQKEVAAEKKRDEAAAKKLEAAKK